MRKLLALILLAVSAAHATVDLSACTTSMFDNALHGSASLPGFIGVITGLLILVLAFAYMFGTAFNRVEYVMLAKDEFFHLGISFMLLTFFATVMVSSCGVMGYAFDFAYDSMRAHAVAEDDCYSYSTGIVQNLATCYLGKMETDADGIVKQYTTANIQFLMDSSAYKNYFGYEQGTTFMPNGYKRTYAAFAETVKNVFVLPAYISIKSQDLFISLLMGDADSAGVIFSVVIPAAFVLRFIPPLRQAGNMLIAFAVGVYLIIPFFIALNGMMYTYTFTAGDCDAYATLVEDKVLGTCTSGYNLLEVARLYPQAFLLPNLTIAIFVTFINSINKALRVLG